MVNVMMEEASLFPMVFELPFHCVLLDNAVHSLGMHHQKQCKQLLQRIMFNRKLQYTCEGLGKCMI